MANSANANAANAADAKDEDVSSRVGVVEQRITAVEQLLAAKVPGFEQVGARVTELSGAFQQANGRLTAHEQAIERLSTATPPPSSERLSAVEAGLAALVEQVQTLAATRGRSGLSGRLRSIEEKLDALLPVEPTDPPEEP